MPLYYMSYTQLTNDFKGTGKNMFLIFVIIEFWIMNT